MKISICWYMRKINKRDPKKNGSLIFLGRRKYKDFMP